MVDNNVDMFEEVYRFIIPNYHVVQTPDNITIKNDNKSIDIGFLLIEDPISKYQIVKIPYALNILGKYPSTFCDAVYKQPLGVNDPVFDQVYGNLQKLYQTRYYLLPQVCTLDTVDLSLIGLHYLIRFIDTNYVMTFLDKSRISIKERLISDL